MLSRGLWTAFHVKIIKYQNDRLIAPYGHPFTEDYPYQKNVGFCCILTLISGRGLVGDYLAVI